MVKRTFLLEYGPIETLLCKGTTKQGITILARSGTPEEPNICDTGGTKSSASVSASVSTPAVGEFERFAPRLFVILRSRNYVLEKWNHSCSCVSHSHCDVLY